MPKKERKRPTRTRGAGGKRAKGKAAAKPTTARRLSGPPDSTAARERFVGDLLVRGEAAERDEKGKLPLHATHAIKKRKADGSAEVERVRFKTF